MINFDLRNLNKTKKKITNYIRMCCMSLCLSVSLSFSGIAFYTFVKLKSKIGVIRIINQLLKISISENIYMYNFKIVNSATSQH